MQTLGPSVFVVSTPVALCYSWQAARLASDRVLAKVAFGGAALAALLWLWLVGRLAAQLASF